MLTATYSIVAISAEQKNTRKLLAKLQQSIRNIWKNFQEIDFAGVEAAIHKLAQFDQFFHSETQNRFLVKCDEFEEQPCSIQS